jgi:hypothetical protein
MRRHLGEQADVLEGARDAGLGDLVHGGRLVGRAAQHEAAGVGRVQAGDDVEEGGLAGAVGADQAVDLAGVDRDADVRQRLQAAEALGDAVDLENCVAHGVWIPSLFLLDDHGRGRGLAVLGRRPQAARTRQHHADHRQRDQQLAQDRRVEAAAGGSCSGPAT